MKRTIPGALAALSLAGASPVLAASPVTYTVSPRLSGQDLAALEIAVAFEADADGETRLELPDASMGHSTLWRNLSNLTVEGADAVVEDGPAVRVVRSRPGRALVLRYTLRGTLDHEPGQSDSYPAEPWVRPSWFYVDGPSAMVTVEGRDDSPVRLRWGQTWPKAFVLASNLEDGGVVDPRRGVLIGGRDLRIIRAGPVRLALRGTFAFTDADLAASLDTILRAERGFFGDALTTPFLVTAQSLKIEDGGTFSGTGKHQAFAMAVTPDMTLDDIRVLLAHEIFHAWNPSRLGQAMGPGGYWFSEGFTDFYARRLLARERLITPQAFVAVWNTTLKAYDVSPVREMPGDEAAAKFWTDPDADQLAYQRGALLAAIWDQRLRASGASLDAVLRAQTVLKTQRPTATMIRTFVDAAEARGLDVTPDIAAHIDQGRLIRLPADAFAPCATTAEVTEPAFDLGFEPKVDDKGVRTVTKLRPASPAALVGLREGTVILEKRKGVSGDSMQPYELVVRDGDGPARTVSFLPQGAGQRTFQRLTLTPEAVTDPGLCDFGSVRPAAPSALESRPHTKLDRG